MDREPDETRAVKDLESAEAERHKLKQRHGTDREVERETQTVRPPSDAPSRAGISGAGSGADNERG
jgi:hypothetical protein